MGLPPPKLRDLTVWSVGTTASKENQPNEIWEIGVPEGNSLSRSITLSYLYSASHLNLEQRLKKITGTIEEIKEIKIDLNEEQIDTADVERELKSFNPFKNRHASFHQKKILIDLFRIFKLRLNRFRNRLKGRNDEWNDDLKLNAASQLLKCEIEVYFPDQSDNQTLVSYPKVPPTFENKIVLFQYKNRQRGSMENIINVFHFGMTVQQAHIRKIDALGHFLKKAKINISNIEKVKNFMNTPGNHGKSFLPTILQNGLGDILEKIYKSAYIALKLSEAGFETNPAAIDIEDISAFSYAILFNKNAKNFHILYDYASNCRCLFDHSVRKADDKVLETLKEIKELLEKDISMLSKPVRGINLLFEKFGEDACSITVNILQQFILFIEYQNKAASDLKMLKENSELIALGDFEFRKQVIQSILENYLNYFYNNSKEKFSDISDEFINYFQFSNYYESLDYFAYISFFDNFYSLRLCMKKFKQESYFLKIEWRMFASIISTSFYSKHGKKITGNSSDEKKKCQKDNVLRYVSLFFRKALQNEITTFLEKIITVSDPDILQKTLSSNDTENNSVELSEIIDELFTSRLYKHIQAAVEVSVFDDGMEAILVIERALQMIGESIKPPSLNSSSVACFLLKSCLSKNLQDKLISIRNDLSHCKGNSIYRRLKFENNLDYFNSIQKDLVEIKRCFEIVVITQLSRTEGSIMYKCIEEMGKELDPDVRAAFYDEYIFRIDKKVEDYLKPQNKFFQLLLHTVSDIQDNYKSIKYKNVILSHLKAVTYLLHFIVRHINKALKKLKIDFDDFITKNNNMELDVIMNNLDSFLTKSVNELLQYNTETNEPLSAPDIEPLYSSLKADLFSQDEQDEIKHAMRCAYEQGIEANNNLKEMCKLEHCESHDLEESLKRIFSPLDTRNYIKDYFASKNANKALQLLERYHYSKEELEHDIDWFFGKSSSKDKGLSIYFKPLLTKITYQKYLNSPIYTSILLPDNIFEKLENIHTQKVRFLITRIRALKYILIEKDGEVNEAWTWGRSKAMKYHMKFLMRQRYLRDDIIRASLDMAFFDCANILMKPSFKELYEKSTDLFSGINLRNHLAHRGNIPEAMGQILDEKDFPSTMIDKMLLLIDDLEVLESTLELLPIAGVLEEENFVTWIENMTDERYKKQIKFINDCERWKNYLFLFPFIRN